MNSKKMITIEALINAPIEQVWKYWNTPEHVVKWNAASNDWHTPKAENDFRKGGKFIYRMEAKDGSFGFDFGGVYEEVKTNETISFRMDDGRSVKITFAKIGNTTKIVESFEAESTNPIEMQKNGWQSILNNFKKYAEGSQKIIPHIWYDKEAKEAAKFYISIFPNSKITNISRINDTPSGDCDIVSFELNGHKFTSISAGPYFKLNPSISFMLNFDPNRDKNARKNLEVLWTKLSEGGKALMPLGKYPFSELYGWVQDKYGVSWQLILTNPQGEERPFIIPSTMFVGNFCGKAEEASNFYMSIFKNSKRGVIARYPKGMEPDKEGTIMFTDFMLEGQWFVAMDSAHKHDFAVNEAISFIVECEDQKEIDYYWEKLSAFKEAEQCGWLKDKYGVSWQIIPKQMNQMMTNATKEQMTRLTKAFLQMKKFDLAQLKKAYES